MKNGILIILILSLCCCLIACSVLPGRPPAMSPGAATSQQATTEQSEAATSQAATPAKTVTTSQSETTTSASPENTPTSQDTEPASTSPPAATSQPTPEPSDTAAFAFPYKFNARDLYGNDVTEASLGEKELFFVHLWATWCPPCIAEMPELAQIANDYGDRVGFIALLEDYQRGVDAAIRITEASGVPFICVDARGDDFSALLNMLNSGYVPTTVLIGSDGGMIGEQIIGAFGEGYKWLIEDALAR